MKLKVMILALLPVFSMSYAADVSEVADDVVESSDENTVELKTIVVTAPFAQEMGTQHIDRQRIQNRVNKNGTISELLHDNLNVQFSTTDGNSNSAGEIAPENVSFHGEKFYNNNWMIDGMSNNDTVNPGANKGQITTKNPDGSSPWDLPAGGTQSFWLNSDIVKSVDVYDSNISAKYGQFTGGVVDAKLLDPSTKKASGSISYRVTKSGWTRYHVDDDSFYQAEDVTNQPKFDKRIYSVNINQPLGDKAGLLFSYNRTQSKIPYHHQYLSKWENQERVSETYLLKGLYKFSDSDQLQLTAMYSPHQSTYVKPDTVDGRFTNNGGGVRVNFEWEHQGDTTRVMTYLGYKYTQNKIDHEGESYYSWRNKDQYFDWCSNVGCTFSYQGGYGQFETANRTWTFKQDYEVLPIGWGNMKHTLSYGWQADFARAYYKRDKNTYLYTGSNANITQSSSVVCADDDDACIDGLYYFKNRTAYYAQSVKVNNNHYAAYFQDKIDWGKWQITAGLRLDYDQFLKNTNIAPRFTASYDVFGDQSTRIFGGVNRYYSASMLAYKLRETIGGATRETRSSNTSPWVAGATSVSSLRRYLHQTNLKTPYSDEVNLGLSQKWGNTLWTLKWVRRQGKNQFVRTSVDVNGTSYRVLSNNGFNQGNTLTLEVLNMQPWQFKYADISFRAGLNYSQNKSNSDYYDDSIDNDLNKRIIVNDKLLGINDVPVTEYSTPWRVFLDVTTYIPKLHLTWTNTLNYTAGYSAWETEDVVCPAYSASVCGSYNGSATLYTKYQFANALTLDWHISYDIPMGGHKKLSLNLDVTNVLDRVIQTKKSSSTRGNTSNVTYKLGRQFWLGARFVW